MNHRRFWLIVVLMLAVLLVSGSPARLMAGAVEPAKEGFAPWQSVCPVGYDLAAKFNLTATGEVVIFSCDGAWPAPQVCPLKAVVAPTSGPPGIFVACGYL